MADNRASSAALRQLIASIDSSPRMIAQRAQIQGISGASKDKPETSAMQADGVVQAKTTVSWTSQEFPYISTSTKKLENAVVGNRMDAHLDPDEPIKGNDADSNHQKPLYESLAKYWNPGSKKWIRGHMLNANLGGPNVSVNLFPITGHANGDHLHYVENHVKKWLLAKREVSYTVVAHRDASDTGRTEGSVAVPNAKGAFVCFAETLDNEDDKEKKSISRTIYSDPAEPKVNPGHASRVVNELGTTENAFVTLTDEEEEILSKIMDVSDDEELEEVFDGETEDLPVFVKVLIGKMVWGDGYDWEDTGETQDTEEDKAGRTLNAGLKNWINHKKLTKAEVEKWMLKNKEKGTSNRWSVSSS
ncbi:MAG TPA: hypothetical protein VF798_13840 [Burkholderiaceae bacterium]